MPKTVKLAVLNHKLKVVLNKDAKSASISSDLKDGSDGAHHHDSWSHVVDGIESLVLGHACAGLDITAPAYRAGLESALQAAANNADVAEESGMVRLSHKELATVLASLRNWQQELSDCDDEDEGPISEEHFGDGTEPLTVMEIDELCERLNCG